MTEKDVMCIRDNAMIAAVAVFGAVKNNSPVYSEEIREAVAIMHKAVGFNYDEVALEVVCPNGYTASIVRKYGTYGAEQGLFEIAVIRDNQIVYDTPVTHDVLGYQSQTDVIRAVAAIAAL